MTRIGVGAAFFLLGLGGLVVRSAAAGELADAASRPVDGGGPTAVAIGFHVIDFGRVTARDETFDLTAHLVLRWRDPRLSGGRGKRPANFWTPKLCYDNAVEPPRPIGEASVEIGDDGTVTSRSIFCGKFSSSLDLRKFPFDRQELAVRISLADDESKVRFVLLTGAMGMHNDVFLSDWEITGHQASVGSRQYRPGDVRYSALDHRVTVRRRATFYAWRVVLPLALMTLIPWLVFWFEPTNLQPQISTCMATLIAMVTYGYTVDFALPKVAYLTVVDRHALAGFLFTAAAALAVTVIHRATTRADLPRALRIQRRFRWIYLVAYALVCATNLGLALVA